MWKERFGNRIDKLKGRVCWVTGASSGIGEYLSYELARANCKLVLSARNKAALDEVKKRCLTTGRLTEDDILVLPFDVKNVGYHKEAMQIVLKKFNQIDILINNAGRSQREFIIDTDISVDKELIDLNVLSPISLVKCVLPDMIKRKSGHIVVTSSLAGKFGLPYSASYCLSKWAINGWHESLYCEMKQHNIDVTIVCPGPIDTKCEDNCISNSFKKSVKKMTSSRCAELMLVAIVNKLQEVWIARQPFLFFTYLNQFLPQLVLW
ncbi:hypothetical protein HELRODRAFT_65082 [Helobdella robusta]|uniref:Dehydrogenase/reductase SDR family member 7 n=1 Tax=Helobdella robusta TaxID=6412 RepID=T1FY32_HELRO|nr:hypothetical protein HELRODRAFT_65082 [Helobdella robusta]ESO02714.1 hypothetical protein HELRODRAFT_65082 [Helobdella robusta]